MQEPSSAVVQPFKRQIQAMLHDFRIVWGEKSYGVCRWVVERRLPDAVHGQCLREFAEFYPGQERYVDQQLTNDAGEITGTRRVDLVSEWVHVHTIQDVFYDLDDPRGYRLPDQRDIGILWNYLHEFRNMEEQMKAVRDEQEAAATANRKERVACLAQDIKDSRSIWELPEPMYVSTTDALPGTEL